MTPLCSDEFQKCSPRRRKRRIRRNPVEPIDRSVRVEGLCPGFREEIDEIPIDDECNISIILRQTFDETSKHLTGIEYLPVVSSPHVEIGDRIELGKRPYAVGSNAHSVSSRDTRM